jgi:hypothetical protein
MLGQHLLSDSLGAAAVQAGSSAPGSFASNSSIPTEVLVTAARQHLMSAEALQLQIPHVALLLADYQQLAASYHAHLMLSRWVGYATSERKHNLPISHCSQRQFLARGAVCWVGKGHV